MSSDDMLSGDEGEVPRKNYPWNVILQEIQDSERRTKGSTQAVGGGCTMGSGGSA